MEYQNILITVFLLLLGQARLQAQETAITSGGSSTGVGGTVSYTIGQVFYNTNSDSNGSVAQGVQQPYEISIVSGIEEGEGISLNYSAYPNPTTEFLTLRVEYSNVKSLFYQIYDVNGNLLESKRIEGQETIISTKYLLPSIYFLWVVKNNKEVKTLKIIKN